MRLIDVQAAIRKSLKNAGQFQYHTQHRTDAGRALRQLERRTGQSDPELLRRADEYAQDVFGSAIFAPWLRFYAAFNGQFKEGWIPDNYYGSTVVPRMKGLYGKVSDLRPLSRILFGDDASLDLVYLANGLFYTRDGTPISECEVRSAIIAQPDNLVVKLDGSGKGHGVYVFDRTSFDVAAVRRLGNGVIQRFIRQHPVFTTLVPGPVATLRMTTVVDDLGRISVRASYLRLGRAQDTHVVSHREVSVPVDLKTGQLSATGYLDDWTPVEQHPDSGCAFSGITVPAFRLCVAKVLDLHGRFPFARCIGWDITVDEREAVQVMEWNGGHNDIKFSEATQGPCFADLNWHSLWKRPSQGDM